MINKLYCTNYRISTITSGVYLTIPNIEKLSINLLILFNNIKIFNKNNNFIYTQHIDSNKEKIVRGNIHKKKRSSNKDRTFDNQISFIFKIGDNYYPNIKVFQNGNLHITGCRCLDDINYPLLSIINEIKKIFNENNDLIINIDNNDINELRHDDVKIFMINTDFKVYINEKLSDQFLIKRRLLHDILISNDNTIARFDPSTYPGVKIEYWWSNNKDMCKENDEDFCKTRRNLKKKISNYDKNNDKKITIAVFESGSVLITGAISLEQVNEAYIYICKILDDNKNKIYLEQDFHENKIIN